MTASCYTTVKALTYSLCSFAHLILSRCAITTDSSLPAAYPKSTPRHVCILVSGGLDGGESEWAHFQCLATSPAPGQPEKLGFAAFKQYRKMLAFDSHEIDVFSEVTFQKLQAFIHDPQVGPEDL